MEPQVVTRGLVNGPLMTNSPHLKWAGDGETGEEFLLEYVNFTTKPDSTNQEAFYRSSCLTRLLQIISKFHWNSCPDRQIAELPITLHFKSATTKDSFCVFRISSAEQGDSTRCNYCERIKFSFLSFNYSTCLLSFNNVRRSSEMSMAWSYNGERTYYDDEMEKKGSRGYI